MHLISFSVSLATGVSDHVKCFDCSGGLKDWEPEDDPWTEHTRWYPKCRYVNLIKGKEFIDDVHRRFPPNVPSHISRVCFILLATLLLLLMGLRIAIMKAFVIYV